MEGLTMLILVSLFTVVSPLVKELFPFSAATMFAYPLRQACLYEVRSPTGKRLRKSLFGLQINNPHDPPVKTLGRSGYGRRSPLSLQETGGPAPYGQVASKEEVTHFVGRRLLTHAGLKFVVITQKIYGPGDDGRVRLLAERHFKVSNPRYRR